MTTQDAAKILNVTRQTIHAWIKKGKIKAKKREKTRFYYDIPEKEIMRLVEDN